MSDDPEAEPPAETVALPPTPASAAWRLLPGTVASPAPVHRLEHYEVLTREDDSLWELGRGAMGATFKALDTRLHCHVALKVINADLLTDHPELRERFLREARAAARLRHPNIASVFHLGETAEGQAFYAMEFIEGETLEARVRRRGPLPVNLALELATEVARALVAAGAQGLVHRDLKPANLMLVDGVEAEIAVAAALRPPGGGSGDPGSRAEAGEAWVKVIDFGLAKAAADAGPLTGIGEFLGTPQFASPEQFADSEHGADARSDIYSLGVTLWYALTGKLPFTGRSLSEIRARQLSQRLPGTHLEAAHVPAHVAALLAAMLATDPAARPTPHALLDSLRRCRAVLAPPTSPGRTTPAPAVASLRRTRPLAAPAALLVLVAGAAAWWFSSRPGHSTPPPPAPERSIAVLPLENLSADPDNLFFADGIQGDVLASLAKITQLKVISRASVSSYKAGAPRNLREIGVQLNVANVLTGSVRRAGNRVLVNVELVSTRDDRQLWAERYDRTLADSLTLQGELATEIAGALRATLSPAEQAQVAARPTGNADAYLLYLRGREAQTTTAGLLEDYLRAARLYEEAIARDPDFALARARLSATVAYLYQQYQPTAANRARARAEADAALRLRPDLGEGHLARALCLYWLDRNYDAALAELDLARRLLPNDSDVDATAAYIARRRGRWDEARDAFHRILTRDPRNGQLASELCFTDVHLRDWPAAMRSGDLAVTLDPGSPAVVIYRRYTDFWTRGDLAPLKAALGTFPPGVDPDGAVTAARWDVALMERDFPAAERAVADCALDPLPVNLGPPLPKSYLLGCVALARGDTARAQELFRTALPTFEAEVQASPQAAFRHARLGLVYAFLGRRGDALREGRRAVELLPESNDALDAPQAASFLALILAWTGEPDEALTLIERLLRTPGPPDPYEASLTLADLQARWQWEPLRADPRFQALLAGPEPRTVSR